MTERMIGSAATGRRLRQGGFTLIELISVITILRILAAFSLPRFANLGANARIATLQSLGGSLRSAGALAHSLQLTGNVGLNGNVAMEGATVELRNGYPRANTTGIGAAMNIDGFNQSGGGSGANSTTSFGITTYTPSGGRCRVRCQAANPGAGRDMPAITIETTGC